MRISMTAIALAVAVSACSSGTDGPIPIGAGKYYIEDMGFRNYSADETNKGLITEGRSFCLKQGKDFEAIEISGNDYGPTYASGKVIFKCV